MSHSNHNPIPGFYDDAAPAGGGSPAARSKRAASAAAPASHHAHRAYDGTPPGFGSPGLSHRGGVLYAVTRYVTHIRLSRLIGGVLLILIIIPLLTHYYISNMGVESDAVGHRSRKLDNVLHIEELPSVKVNDLKFRIEELKKIKHSVNTELVDLEARRQKMMAEISGYSTHIEKLKNEYESTNKDLQQLKISMENTKLEQEEIVKRNTPELQAPRRILPGVKGNVELPPPASPGMCRMHSCFDQSRCSVTSQFPVYFYDPVDHVFTAAELDSFVKASVTHALNASPHFTFDPLGACIYVVLLGDVEGRTPASFTNLQQKLRNLPHWHGDGRNHVILNLVRNYSSGSYGDALEAVDTGRALVVQAAFTERGFRGGFDVLAPPLLGISHGDVWDQLPLQVPAKRRHLLTFLGELKVIGDDTPTRGRVGVGSASVKDLIQEEKNLVETLKRMQSMYRDDGFHFEFACERQRIFGEAGEWALCGPEAQRHQLLRDSTFSLVLAPVNTSFISTVLTQTRVFEALKYGAIPVILGDNIQLPFSEVLDWGAAVVTLPKARITELHFFLRSLSDNDVLGMRRQGRIFWETHLGSTRAVLDTVLGVLRSRLRIPAFPVREEPSPSVFNDTYRPLIEDVIGESGAGVCDRPGV